MSWVVTREAVSFSSGSTQIKALLKQGPSAFRNVAQRLAEIRKHHSVVVLMPRVSSWTRILLPGEEGRRQQVSLFCRKPPRGNLVSACAELAVDLNNSGGFAGRDFIKERCKTLLKYHTALRLQISDKKTRLQTRIQAFECLI